MASDVYIKILHQMIIFLLISKAIFKDSSDNKLTPGFPIQFLPCQLRIVPDTPYQYHGCWCPGDLKTVHQPWYWPCKLANPFLGRISTVHLNIKLPSHSHFTRIGIPIIKIRWSHDGLKIIKIHISGKTVFILKQNFASDQCGGTTKIAKLYFNGLMQERCNSSANELELHLFALSHRFIFF